MGVRDTLARWIGGELDEQRSGDLALSFQEWVNYFTYNNNMYAVAANQTLVGDNEEIQSNFTGLVAGAYKSDGVVFACMLARQLLFSEARFQFRQRQKGRPGDLFGTPELSVLEHPWRGATTGDLLGRAIQDADLAGTAFIVRRRRDRISRFRPDWTTMVIGSPNADSDATDPDAELLGLIFHPGGQGSGHDPIVVGAENVAIFAPIPDPTAILRGMSWLTPVVREIQGDLAATAHKERYFEKGATVNLVVQTGIPDVTKFREWVRMFRDAHDTQAAKTLFLQPGSEATPIGSNLVETDFKSVQGSGETRIAAASGMHPVVVGLSEGLAGSSLNAGNFNAARRIVADKTLRPLWRNIASSLESIIAVPDGAELWYDDRDIAFLSEDVKDRADVQAIEGKTIGSLIDHGFPPDDAINAVTAYDWERLIGTHTGLNSVQLQAPLSTEPQDAEPKAPTNGQGSQEDANALVSQEG